METEPERAFEDALRSLEQIVEDLERGEPGLAVALNKYEQGVRLLVRCQTELDRAERSVLLLHGVDPDGNPLTGPFDATATADRDGKPAAPPGPPSSRTSPQADDADLPF